jgi:hypothetical protein
MENKIINPIEQIYEKFKLQTKRKFKISFFK